MEKNKEELEKELNELKLKINQAVNWAPIAPESCPSAPEELVRGYRVGWSNSWIAYRQMMKRLFYNEG